MKKLAALLLGLTLLLATSNASAFGRNAFGFRSATAGGVNAHGYFPTGIPATSGTLKLWLEADRGTQSSAGKVHIWGDQSANANNVTGTTAGQEIAFTAGCLNGFPCLKTVSAASYKSTTLPFATGDFSVFVVANVNTTSAQSVFYSNGLNTNGLALGVDIGTSGKRQLNWSGVVSVTDNTSNATTGWELWTVTATTTPTQTFRVNGVQHTLSNAAVSMATPTTNQFVASWTSGSGSIQGSIAAIVVYAPHLSAADTTTVENYFIVKYGPVL
jgi:hypothetical protein